ncbi:Sodium/hydrogen exchanger family-domain-containing protein [Exophiala viscosa]|uniref:Sodium/hydrogen exchanger family-domain-containing protein n=1 Tax=Exophiala viscosa TaxID=2486360 RepID=A0AAN6DMT5_9EURO|nr:Sodium/hydrogen exchanger family-domain-containing protein [Exophiala viscosa]KAI1620099.1 Sodium/hydrogen exchanger family-domain-containing protein [Exophiala viscosa]
MVDAAVSYAEPGIVTILAQSSFFLLSNVINSVLDHVLYCGLVGQVLLGMAWGTPGAKLLSESFEDIATQLGYLGLIAIVFEGGLSTSISSVQKTLWLSIGVAITGILLPIAFSFSLLRLVNSTKLEAFAAGAALCSTSLGTTFSLLKSTGLTTSRLGTVLTTAAMLDDVVGLVMVQVIANLGSGDSAIHASNILRPILVSAGFAIVVPVFCKFVLKPIMVRPALGKVRTSKLLERVVNASTLSFLLSTTLLVGLVSAASYAGTSTLFAAYLAGAAISWVDEMAATLPAQKQFSQPHPNLKSSSHEPAPLAGSDSSAVDRSALPHGPGTTVANEYEDLAVDPVDSSRLPTPPPEKVTDAEEHAAPTTSVDVSNSTEPERSSICMYSRYYAPAVEHILKPLFFASIGFSIPISRMFRASIVWRGLIYAILMCVGKVCCGFWLVRFSPQMGTPSTKNKDKTKSTRQKSWPRPKSLYPAAILGCAMVARGEIGFLISAVAATNGIFSTANSRDDKEDSTEGASSTSDIYLIVTWAILLCTIIGPVSLGFLAKRAKRLQSERAQTREGAAEDPFGIWGVG